MQAAGGLADQWTCNTSWTSSVYRKNASGNTGEKKFRGTEAAGGQHVMDLFSVQKNATGNTGAKFCGRGTEAAGGLHIMDVFIGTDHDLVALDKAIR